MNDDTWAKTETELVEVYAEWKRIYDEVDKPKDADPVAVKAMRERAISIHNRRISLLLRKT